MAALPQAPPKDGRREGVAGPEPRRGFPQRPKIHCDNALTGP